MISLSLNPITFRISVKAGIDLVYTTWCRTVNVALISSLNLVIWVQLYLDQSPSLVQYSGRSVPLALVSMACAWWLCQRSVLVGVLPIKSGAFLIVVSLHTITCIINMADQAFFYLLVGVADQTLAPLSCRPTMANPVLWTKTADSSLPITKSYTVNEDFNVNLLNCVSATIT